MTTIADDQAASLTQEHLPIGRICRYSLDPYTDLGSVTCPTGTPLAPFASVWPYSMTADRHGYIWLFYTSGELFKVDIETMECSKTSYLGPADMEVVLMAFGGADPTNESLFMTATPTDDRTFREYREVNPGTFEVLTTDNFRDLSSFAPKLSGTSDGKMFGFRPTASGGLLEEMDLGTGLPTQDWLIPSFARSASLTGWNIAPWKGQFFIFSTNRSGIGPPVHQVSSFDPNAPEDQRLTTLPSFVSREIYSAAMSTCAPAWE